MKLIRRQGYKIVVADEAFLIKSIRLLFEADESEDKQFFFKEISYLYFMVDPSSSLSYIKDDEERSQTIIEQEGLSKNFKPSKLLKTAMQDYGKHTVTTSQLLLQDTEVMVNKIREYLKSIDLSENLDNGKPKYPINQIVSTISQMPQLVKAINKAQHELDNEIVEEDRIRGSIDKKVCEDGVDL